MTWQDLLEGDDRKVVCAPWIGGRELRQGSRAWSIAGQLPREHGWYTFETFGRTARLRGTTDPEYCATALGEVVRGYLVGDRVVPDGARCDPDPLKIFSYSEQVYLLEPGLDRLARVRAARAWVGGPLVYQAPEMPLGPEPEVLEAYLSRAESVRGIRDVAPALDAAFRLESWHRAEVERRRQEAEQERLAEEERRRVEGLVGTGAGRRELAAIDFASAARAALSVSGAEYLDHVPTGRGEMTVRYRLDGRRFECVCDARTLRIVDAGICLRADGEVGDTKFTLESLPAVVLDAERRGVLHVFRHVGGDGDWED